MSPEQTAQILRQFHGAYNTEITEDMARQWANTFSRDDVNIVREAATIWIAEEERFPTPAGLRVIMRAVARRQAMEHPPPVELPSGQREITGPEGGFRIAFDNYERECRRLGRVPRLNFDQFVGRLPTPSARERR